MLRVTALLAVAAVCANAMQFAVIGDWGTGGKPAAAQCEMRSAMALNEACARLGCNFTLSCGDNIYAGNVLQGLQDSFADSFTMPGPTFASIGNHDNVGPQLDYSKKNHKWKFPKRWYDYKVPIDGTGYTAHIFAVDTTDGSLGGGAQYKWLESLLKTSDARWKIIFGHYPFSGSGRHKRVGTVGQLAPLMERYNAQVYFAGHDHIVDVSNMGGRVLPISGAMARGGMMLRAFGGAPRQFSLTNPSEYNAFKADWPGHGFMTVDLSPNVMTVSVWDHYGGIMYEFSTTHDWLLRVKDKGKAMAEKEKHEWPPAAAVHEAFMAEKALPKGPGGGEVFNMADGTSATQATRATAPPPSLAPLSPGETAKATAEPATLPPLTMAPKATVNVAALTAAPKKVGTDGADAQQVAVPDTVKYTVGSECAECGNKPVVGKPFSVYVDGVDLDSRSRLYLSDSEFGCAMRGQPRVVAGTPVERPTSNVVVFTVGVATQAYVCLSVDDGRSFAVVYSKDDYLPVKAFTVAAPGAAAQAPNAATPAPGSAAPNQWVGTPPPAAGGGVSVGTLIVVCVLCLAVGGVGAVWYTKQNNMAAAAQRVPTAADDEE
jgi:hypothetical protein